MFDSFEEKNESAHLDGLSSGHAYSIIKVEHFEEEDIKLLQIRNPWGRGGDSKQVSEWDGDWSNGSQKWEEVEGSVSFFNLTLEADDGTFWISFEDFIEQFEEIAVC